MASPVVECGPTEEECRALVQRIISAKDFLRANRLRDFLLYVVDRKFADSPHEVTETLIGQRVFGRPAMYNTGEDSIVRTEARILRQRLERYFAGEGIDEPIVLEIPKGSYIPVFRRRDPVAAEQTGPPVEAKPSRRKFIGVALAGASGLAGAAAWIITRRRSTAMSSETHARTAALEPGKVNFDSSDARLVSSFRWAKQRALEYAYTGDPIGAWYDSTAGNRYAFCMRDTSHQSVGAAVLGLEGHTYNMLRRFAASIAPSRDWCGYWEINKDGFPAPIDYQDDGHFWYCLPANFDVMQAAYRQYLWTGNVNFLDSVFSYFYDRTVTDYVDAWDKDRDGVMESSPDVRPRGIPSYCQERPYGLIGGDLLAAQYIGYTTYAAIQDARGSEGSLSRKLGGTFDAKAKALKLRYNSEWWNPIQNRHYSLILPNRNFFPGYIAEANVFALLFGLPEDGVKTEAALDALERNRPDLDQKLSYFPEILFQYGRNGAAYEKLLELTDSNFRGRGMPEIVFAVVGAMGSGLMGVSPNAPGRILETIPRLPSKVAWARISHVPVVRNEIEIEHRIDQGGLNTSIMTNQNGPEFIWKAGFPAAPGRSIHFAVDGVSKIGRVESRINGQLVASVLVPVKAGKSVRVTYNRSNS